MTTASAHMFNALALELYTKAYERHHGAPPNPRDEYEHIVEPIAKGLASIFAFGVDMGPMLRGPTLAQFRERLRATMELERQHRPTRFENFRALPPMPCGGDA